MLFSEANLKDFHWALWNIWPRRYTVSGYSTSEFEERLTVITKHARQESSMRDNQDINVALSLIRLEFHALPLAALRYSLAE